MHKRAGRAWFRPKGRDQVSLWVVSCCERYTRFPVFLAEAGEGQADGGKASAKGAGQAQATFGCVGSNRLGKHSEVTKAAHSKTMEEIAAGTTGPA